MSSVPESRAPGALGQLPDEADQSRTMAFLSQAANYAQPAVTVERIETHCSIVFLVDDLAFKLKRAIAFSSLDYTRRARREQACWAELTLNRRTAPQLYLGVRSINRDTAGRLAFDGPGPALDWVVMMRRFPQSALFDAMAASGGLTPPLMRELGATVAQFHVAAEVTPAFGGHAGLLGAIEHNHRELGRCRVVLDAAAIASLRTASLTAMGQHSGLLERRRRGGKVRRGHGDLRLANVCLYEGRPTLFDCIEFSDEISCIDVLYDLAFLLMDLERRGLAGLADTVLAAYLDASGDHEGVEVLPLFLSVRAATRSYTLADSALRKTGARAVDGLTDQARSHLASAIAYLQRPARRP